MSIYKELYQIAAAKYGLQLKDPIFAAFDKLLADPKFELMKSILEDDYENFNDVMNNYYISNTICMTLRNILDLLMTLNGRKGFYAKHMNGHGEYDESNIAKWINYFALELINSGTGIPEDGTVEKGSSPIDGLKIRAAIYYILDILQYSKSVTNETPFVEFPTPCCVMGREVTITGVYGTKEGLGEMMTVTEYPTLDHPGKTISGYGFYLNLTDLYSGDTIEIPIFLGDEKLYEGEFADVGYEFYTKINVPYGLYKATITNGDEFAEYISTTVRLTYNAIKEVVTPDINNYVYELYGQSNLKARTIFYKGEDTKVVMPDTFETGTLTDIGATTFTNSDVELVYIPEGVTSIE